MLRALAGLSYSTTLRLVAGLIVLAVALSGLRPSHPSDWLLENALVVLFLAAAAIAHRWMRLSRLSWLLICVFLCLHEVGAHYTYAEVPYDDWTRAIFGVPLGEALGFGRNHFDRLVHFGYGLLFAYPIREVFLRVGDASGFWGYFLPLALTMSTSMLYELLEWGAAILFGGDLGVAYLGTQGDPWDAQKDMALASLGALVAMLVTAAVNARVGRDDAPEWRESLRVEHPEPLGEERVEQLVRSDVREEKEQR